MINSTKFAASTCDDVLFDILIRLPPKCVFKFIIVSKSWLRVICSSFFHTSYLARWGETLHLAGFFVSNRKHLVRTLLYRYECQPWNPQLMFLTTSNECSDLRDSGFLKKLGYYMDSCKDFLLCGRHWKTYYVWNLITKQLFQLPSPQEVWYQSFATAFMCEECPAGGICCKVVLADAGYKLHESNTVSIITYSSKTDMWERSTLTCSATFELCSCSATVIAGVIHWVAAPGHIAIYDPDQEDSRIFLIELPRSQLTYNFNAADWGESSDGLLQWGQSCLLGIEIWVLEREQGYCDSIGLSNWDYSGKWNMRYKVNFTSVWEKNPSIMRTFCKGGNKIELLSFLPQNSECVVLRAGQRICLYHLESEKLEVIRYQKGSYPVSFDSSKVVPYVKSVWPRSQSS